jgi:hypothetical protein
MNSERFRRGYEAYQLLPISLLIATCVLGGACAGGQNAPQRIPELAVTQNLSSSPPGNWEGFIAGGFVPFYDSTSPATTSPCNDSVNASIKPGKIVTSPDGPGFLRLLRWATGT